ncbi:MAG: AmmeMemoRadiSam system radical SAM enzyme [Desulfatiglandales bacterium]
MLKEARLYEAMEDHRIHCLLCNHHCAIKDSKFGFCGVRQNREGKLYTYAYGETVAAHTDPIEKKPLYHFLPGTNSFSIATAGCNFRCGFCQNWQISQILPREESLLSGRHLLPHEIVRKAEEEHCRSIAYTYTEPTIFFEYAYDTAVLAQEKGLYNVFVTNGFMTVEALKTIHPYLDACNVDLKFFRDDLYRKSCHGHLDPVLTAIRTIKELGIWLEITTLVIPGENDDEEQLSGIAHFIADVDPDIPWHISRFHPDYQYGDLSATPPATLKEAYALGKEAGLRYLYVGNVPQEYTETLCPKCHRPLIRRRGFFVEKNEVKGAACPVCGENIAGVFH